MKKLFVSLALVAGMFAAGAATIPLDNPQTGSFTFSAATGLTTNLFFVSQYSQPPVVLLYPGTTNNSPLALSAITTSNFNLTVTTGSTTNVTVVWYAQPAAWRIQSGTNTVTAATPLLVTFPAPYFSIPAVSLSQNSTNSSAIISVTGLTRTNFTVTGTATGQFGWSSFGPAYTAGYNAVTY